MSDLYKEFTDFCEKHNRCKDCEYKDIEHCHFSWAEDKIRSEERESTINKFVENLKNISYKYCDNCYSECGGCVVGKILEDWIEEVSKQMKGEK